jgi:Flp pilus assembly protein CpaB
MRPKSLLLLVLALGCGLVASIGISEMMDQGDKSAVETEPILVALIDIERSTLLTKENVALKERPINDIPENAIRDFADIEGMRPTGRIGAGLPIVMSMIGGSTRPSVDIPEGHRVVPVTVSQESGLGLIKPGDRVDVQVFVRENIRMKIPKTMIKTFLEDVSVFATDTDVHTDEEGGAKPASTISLLVTPEQGAKVALAAEIGKIRLVLRRLDSEESGGNEVQATAENIFDDVETFDDGVDEEKASLLAQLDAQRRQFDLELAALRSKTGPQVTWKTTIIHNNVQEVYEFTSDSAVPRKVGDSDYESDEDEDWEDEDEDEFGEEDSDEETTESDSEDEEISESQIKDLVEEKVKDLFGE